MPLTKREIRHYEKLVENEQYQIASVESELRIRKSQLAALKSSITKQKKALSAKTGTGRRNRP